MLVGLISDTHGLLRPEALQALAGVDHLIHGGDIGDQAILRELEGIAPLTVVRGNNDTQDWARALPHEVTVQLQGVTVRVIHDAKELRGQPIEAGVVVSGHSHKPQVEQRDEVLFVNPGSAGPRRFSLPVTVALLDLHDGKASARVLRLL